MVDVSLRLRVDGQQAVVTGIDQVTGALDRNTQGADRDTLALQRNASAVEQLKNQRALGTISLRDYEAQLNSLASQQSASAQAARAQAAELEALRTKFDPAFAAAQRLTAEQQQLKRALDLGVVSQQRYTELLGQMTKASATAGVSMGQIAQATRQLPMQMQDVFVSLQAGQSPLTVFMQQGSQIAGSYGSASLALRSVGTYLAGMITPVTASAAALGAMALAAYQGSREMDGYRTALTLTGYASGMTAGQISGMAQAIRASGTATQGAAADALAELVTNGRVSKEQLQGAAQAALAWGKATGASAADVAKNFAELAKDPLGGTMRLNEGMNYLTASTYQQIKALTDQGRATDAAAVAQKAYADAMRERAPELLAQTGYLEQGWRGVQSAISGAWDALKGVGREQSAEDKLADKTAIIEQTRRLIDQSDGVRAARLRNRLSALLEEQSILQSQAREVQRATSLSTQQAEQVKARAEADKDGLKYLTEEQRLRKDIAQETQRLRDAGASDAEIAQRTAAIRYKTDLGYMQARVQASQGLRKLDDAEAEASIKHQVAVELLTQEQGIRAVTALRAQALRDQAADADRLARATAGRDPLQSAQSAARAAELRKEAINAENAGARELAEIAHKREREYFDALGKFTGDSIARRQALEEESRAIALQMQQAARGGVVIDSVATLLEREKLARYDVALATAQQTLAAQQAAGATGDQIRGYEEAVAMLQRLRDGTQEVAQASADKDLKQAGLDQAKRLLGTQGTDQAQDPFKAWGSTLRETFATAGDGLARMTDAMGQLVQSGRDYGREMEVIARLRASGDADNMATAAKTEAALIAKTRTAQVSAYAAMAGAAKGYFKEGTTGYKAMNAAEKGLRTYQLVMSAQTMAKDLEGIAAKVAAWVTGETTMTAASTVATATRVGEAATEGAAAASVGVANQAKGDPYTAFARIAAMAAIMAALGFAVGGGGGGGGNVSDSFAALPANEGKGTVFGDRNAVSQSISDSLAALESMASPQLQYTSQMVMYLRSIDQALGGATGLLLTEGMLATSYANTSGGGKSFLGFSSESSSSSASAEGVNFAAQSVASAARSVAVEAFRIIHTEWSSSEFWGLSSDSGSYDTTVKGTVGGAATDKLTKAVIDMRSAALASAKLLGNDAAATVINAMDTGLGKVEWKPDASFDEINKKISAVFSQLGDRMAKAVLPSIELFAQGGEGYLQTLSRVASGMEQAGQYADRLGLKLTSLSSLENKSGDVAAELLRQTIVDAQSTFATTLKSFTARTWLTGRSYTVFYEEVTRSMSGIGQIIQSFTGSAAEMATLYKDLLDVQSALVSMGQSASAVTVDLLKGAGGVDALKSGLDSFESNFLTDAERAASLQSRVAADFVRLGLEMPASAEAFKTLVKQTDATTAAGQERLGKLLSLSDSYSQYLSAKTAAEQAQKDLLDATVQAGKDIVGWVAKLDSGSLGLASPLQRAQSASTNYAQQLGLARAGDKTALEGLTGVAQDYLQAARDSATNQLQYAIQLAQVKSDLTMLPASRTYLEQLTEEQLQAMADVRDGVQALKDAMADLQDVQLAQATTLAANTGQTARRVEDLLKFWQQLEADGAFPETAGAGGGA